MTEGPFDAVLAEQGYAVLDGGSATELEAAGHGLTTRLWSARVLADDPDALVAVHAAFLEAGADCITSASYQATLQGFAEAGFAATDARALLARSVEVAVRARDAHETEPGRARPLVAASVGPYGAYLADGSEYTGHYGLDRAALRDFHRERIAVLLEAAPDLLAFETVPSAVEAEALLDLLDGCEGARAWLSFTCADGARLRDGSRIGDAVRLCAGHAGVVAVGVNCTEPRFVGALLAAARAATDLPLIAYPNSGERWDPAAKRWRGEGDRRAWGTGVTTWLEAGARIVGGCCRIGPREIQETRAAAERWRAPAGPGG